MKPRMFRDVALSAMPIVFLLLMFLRYSPDWPYLDQWEFVPFLQKYAEGSLAWGDFWAQHNEHRIVLPRAVMLGCAVISHWDVRAELLVNLILGVGIFGVWVRLAGVSVCNMPSLGILLSLLAFSLSQWQNWFLGWQLQEFMNVLSVCLSVLGLSRAEESRVAFAGAVLSAVAATYCFANGMVMWGAGALMLVCMRGANRKQFHAYLAVWTVAGAFSVGAYFWNYARPAYHPALSSAASHPMDFPLYVFEYLGQPLCNWSEYGAALVGLAGLAGWCVLLRVVAPKVRAAIWSPYLALGVYAVVSAAVTGVARLDMGGTAQAMSSRYVTMANLLWLSVIVLSALWASAPSATDAVRWRLNLSATALAALLVVASLYGAYRWTERYHAMLPAREALLQSNDLDLLGRLYPKPEVVVERREILRQYGLSLFKKRAER